MRDLKPNFRLILPAPNGDLLMRRIVGSDNAPREFGYIENGNAPTAF
jgi:hypothetical protein